MGTFIIGDYKIDKDIIGEGTFSSVYKGKNLTNQINVAVKKINRKGLKKMRSYIDREIKIMKKLNHKNILKLYDVIYEDYQGEENIYIILEYCSRGDLSKFLNGNPLREKFAKKYLKQLSEGIKYLLENNISHRDLKPQNILIYDDLSLKITDFGFAKTINSECMSQTVCGSPLYMAPEILNYKKYTDKADLWSVGVILYEMLTGKTPYKANNIYDLVRMMKYEEVIIPNYINLSSECKHILFSLLQKDPKKRLTWEKFYHHPWFTDHEKIDNLYNEIFNEKLEKKYVEKISIDHTIIIEDGDHDKLDSIFIENKDEFVKNSIISDSLSSNDEMLFNFDEDLNRKIRSPSNLQNNDFENNNKNIANQDPKNPNQKNDDDYILVEDKLNQTVNYENNDTLLNSALTNISTSFDRLKSSILFFAQSL